MNAGNESLDTIVEHIAGKSLPPIHEWRPSITRDIDIRIAPNADWYYQGSLIQRKRMIQLFSTVLRVDNDGHTYLVTPHERLRIQVDDAPFCAVLVDRHGVPDAPTLVFTTNVGDRVIASGSNPISVEYQHVDDEPSPYLIVRDRLRARISRRAFYDLVEWAEERDGVIGVVSGDQFMPLSPPGEPYR
ncbi:MAG: DUF1285 domain-containing protein [Granulosicoccus sp.]|nr:DUF1285 domain-containing protein [Granulosicoccus sp.]